MIVGDDDNIEAIPLLNEEGIHVFTEKVESRLEELTKKNKVLVLTDLKGGTPYNVALKYQLQNSGKVEVVSGMNLPMVIEIALEANTSNDSKALADKAVTVGIDGIQKSSLSDDGEDEDIF